MSCPSCGHENVASSRFCGGCGTALARTCAGCGHPSPPQDRFCGQCGASIEPAQEPDRPVVERAPRSYTPPHLADKILRSRAALEGERKQVTVMFADVQGSMELAAEVDPEEWHAILDGFFTVLSDGVHRFEGTVNQYTGDGIMALFGAPIAHEDHAQRACAAALTLRGELRRYANELKMERGLGFSARIGLNSGEVVVGRIGDDLRMDYTAQGATVGLAQRMEQLAEPGTVYLTEHTADLVRGYFALEDLGAAAIKGSATPVRTFVLTGLGPLRTRLDVSRSRGFSRFVGRASDLTVLEAALAQARAGDGRVVGIVGEAGVGKSRLCYEFAEHCRATGIPVREAHGLAHGKMLPFMPVLEFLRGYYGIGPTDTDEEARRRIAGTVVLLDRELDAELPLLFDFMGVPDPKRPAPVLDPDARQRRLIALQKRLLQVRARDELAVALVDDVHWLDPGSLTFLEHMIDAVPGTRFLILVNFRPEFEATWSRKPFYQQIPLLPLGAEAIDELLADLLGTDASTAALAPLIRERTAGNPFFTEEMVQALAEAGHLEGERGAYRLAQPIDALAIPSSVESLLAARIDRLAEADKLLLQVAAVIGKRFSASLLEEVAAVGESVAASLSRLEDAGFVYADVLGPDVEYSFRHPLTQEVAYRTQLGERRATLHASVARALEPRVAERGEALAPSIARHWELAGERLPAATWHARAAAWAITRDRKIAYEHWRAVYRILAGEVNDEEAALRLSASAGILAAGWQVDADLTVDDPAVTEGFTLAERLGDRRALARLHSGVAVVTFVHGGKPVEALAHARQAVAHADAVGDAGLGLSARNTMMTTMIQLGRLDEALRMADDVVAHPPAEIQAGIELRGYNPFAFISAFRPYVMVLLGRVGEGRAAMRSALELLARLGEREQTVWALSVMTPVPLFPLDESLAHAWRAVAMAEESQMPFSLITAYANLARISNWMGRPAEAEEASRRSLEIGEVIGRNLRTPILYIRTEALLRLGQNAAAEEHAFRAVAEAERLVGGRLSGIGARLILAKVLAGVRGLDAATEIDAALAEAREHIDASGARAFLPSWHARTAELAGLRGDTAARERAVADTRRLLHEMDVPDAETYLEWELE